MYAATIAVMSMLVLGFTIDQASAQSLTIPQMIERAKPNPLEISKSVEWALPEFDVAVRDADLIVQGTLTKLRTYLSEDQKTLFTDYQLAPEKHIASRVPLELGKPGPAPAYVIRDWGGDTVIDGIKVSVNTHGELPMPTGRPVLVFLTFNKEIHKYEIFSGYVFELVAGRQLKPRIAEPGVVDPRLVGRDIADVVNDIHAKRPRG
jgi:hypothetical protein